MSVLINARDAAVKLGYRTPKALAEAVRKQGIPHVKIGRLLRFDPVELDQYIEVLKARRDRGSVSRVDRWPTSRAARDLGAGLVSLSARVQP
jgi:hypothetical protein